ncbi:MAG: TorF family putative porin [Pseudomonadales bacterium]
MKNKVLGTVMGAALLAGSATAVADDTFAAENFSATLTLTQDYTFRGTTFSESDPAIQGSFDWGKGAWFAGVWGSSLNPQETTNDFTAISGSGTLEVDYYFGWADNVGGVDLMVMPLWYTFPGQDKSNARDDTTFELWTSAGIGFDNVPGAPYVTLSANWSDAYFDHGGDALYTSLGVAFSLPQGFGIDFLYGHQDVGGTGENDFFVDDYSHWAVGITKSAAGFDFDMRYHDNEDVSDIGEGFALDGDVVFSVSRSF